MANEWFSWVEGDSECEVRVSDVAAVVVRPSPKMSDVYVRGGGKLVIGQADAARLKMAIKGSVYS